MSRSFSIPISGDNELPGGSDTIPEESDAANIALTQEEEQLWMQALRSDEAAEEARLNEKRRKSIPSLAIVDSSCQPVTPRRCVDDSLPSDDSKQPDSPITLSKTVDQYESLELATQAEQEDIELSRSIEELSTKFGVGELQARLTRKHGWWEADIGPKSARRALVNPENMPQVSWNDGWFTRSRQIALVFFICALVALGVYWGLSIMWASDFGRPLPVEPRPQSGHMHVYTLCNDHPTATCFEAVVHEKWVLLLHDKWSAVFYPDGRRYWFNDNGDPVLFGDTDSQYLSYRGFTQPGLILLYTEEEARDLGESGFYLKQWKRDIAVPDNFASIRVPGLDNADSNIMTIAYTHSFNNSLEIDTLSTWFTEGFDTTTTFGQHVSGAALLETLYNLTWDSSAHQLTPSTQQQQLLCNFTDFWQASNVIPPSCDVWLPFDQRQMCTLWNTHIWTAITRTVCGTVPPCSARSVMFQLQLAGVQRCGDCAVAHQAGCHCWLNTLLYSLAVNRFPCYVDGQSCSYAESVTFPCGVERKCKYSGGKNCRNFLTYCHTKEAKRSCVKCYT